MTDAATQSNSSQRGEAKSKRRIACKPGQRLFSVIETAVAPSLQFCANEDEAAPWPSQQSRALGSWGFPAHVTANPLWGGRGSRLTGNVYIDYRRYCTRGLARLQDLRNARENTAMQSLSLTSRRILMSRHTAAVTRLSLDTTRQAVLQERCLYQFADNGGSIFPRRYLLSSSRDCTIALYDLAADDVWDLNGGFGPEPKVYPIGYVQRKPDSTNQDQQGHSNSVTSVEFMPGDSGLFVSTGLDKLLKIWDTRAWDCVLSIPVESPILCCAFDRVAFQSTRTSPFNSTSKFSIEAMEQPAETPADLLLAAGSQDGGIRIFDLRCGVAQQVLLGHSEPVVSTAWDSRAPFQLFSGSSDRSIKKWDIRRGNSFVLNFDKNKPDLDFIGSRCSQSAAFRQLLHCSEFVGRGYQGEQAFPCGRERGSAYRLQDLFTPSEQGCALDDVAAEAASAAFVNEPSLPSLKSSSSPINSTDSQVVVRSQSDGRAHARKRTLVQCSDNSIDSSTDAGKSWIRKRIKPPNICSSSKPGRARRCHSGSCLRLDASSTGRGQTKESRPVRSSPPEHLATYGESMFCGEQSPASKGHSRRVIAFARASERQVLNKPLRKSRVDVGSTERVRSKRLLDSPARGLSKRFEADYADSRRTASRKPDVANEEGTNRRRLTDLLNQYGEHIKEYRLSYERSASVGISACDVNSSLKCAPKTHNFEPWRKLSELDQATGQRHPSSPEVCDETAPDMALHPCSPKKPTNASTEAGQVLCGIRKPKVAPFSSFTSESRGPEGRFDEELGDPVCPFPCTVSSKEVSAHDGAVTCLLPTADGSFLISSGSDGRIRLWNAANGCHCFVHMSLNIYRDGSRHRQLPAEARQRRDLRFSGLGGGFSNSASTKASSLIWGRQAVVSSTGKYVIHGRGRVLCTYDVFSGTEQQIITPGYTNDIICTTWNDRKCEAYSGASDGAVLIYDTNCGF